MTFVAVAIAPVVLLTILCTCINFLHYISSVFGLTYWNLVATLFSTYVLNSSNFSYTLQLIEAYATAIECCNLFDLKRLANHYLETAMSQ